MEASRESSCRVCGAYCVPRRNQPSVCLACSHFTLRSLNSEEVYTCELSDACEITEDRRRCRACRLRKAAACWEEFYLKEYKTPSKASASRKIRHSAKIFQLRMAISRMDASKKEGPAQGDAGEKRNEAAAEVPVRQNAKVSFVYDGKRMIPVYFEETRRILAGMEKPGRGEEIAAGGSDVQRGTPLSIPALAPRPEQYSTVSVIEEPSHDQLSLEPSHSEEGFDEEGDQFHWVDKVLAEDFQLSSADFSKKQDRRPR